MEVEKQRKLEGLLSTKVKKLAEQKTLADDYNELLTGRGGLNENSLQTCKNLEYAIAIAMRPGTIQYYHSTSDAIERGKLKALADNIQRVQRELDQVNSEIDKLRAGPSAWLSPAPTTDTVPSMPVASIGQWLSRYGEPRETPKGFLTSFEDDRKIYGGRDSTYRGFKSQGKIMKAGRITR